MRCNFQDLLSEKNFLTKLLSSKSLQKKEIDSEIDFLIKKFKDNPLLGKRRTQLDKFGSVNEEDFDNEIKSDDPLTITILKNGFIKSQKSFVKNLEEQIGNESSSLLIHARSNDKIILASNFGKFYTIERLPVLIQVVRFCPSGESARTLFKSSESKLTLSNKQNRPHRGSHTEPPRGPTPLAPSVYQRIFFHFLYYLKILNMI